jgi:hypothetical protein
MNRACSRAATPWTREQNPGDSMVAERLEELNDGKTENQQEMDDVPRTAH